MGSTPRVGKYRLIKRLAAGGMAEVFLAQAEGAAGFAKTVVLKRILPHLTSDPQFVRMFLAEARLASQLSHPNITHIFDLGEANGSYFLAMEFVDGMDLRSIIHSLNESGRRMPVEIALKITSLALEALAYAHDFSDPDTATPLQLVHRDVTPDNILISRQGAVKLVDFGIAKAINQPHLTEAGMLKGKVPYMAPEQLLNEPLNRQTDLFALGGVLFEMLAGSRAFVAPNEPKLMVVIVDGQAQRIAEKRPDAPPEVQAILDKALAKERKDRYPDAAAMQRDVDALLIKLGKSVTARDLGEFIKPIAPPSEVSGKRAPITGTIEKPITLTKRKVKRPPVPETDPQMALSDDSDAPPAADEPILESPEPIDESVEIRSLKDMPVIAEDRTMRIPGRKGNPVLPPTEKRAPIPLTPVLIGAGLVVAAACTVWLLL